MINKNDKIIAYRRVSSDEQAKGYSLDVQKETFKRYQEGTGFKIVLDIAEDYSAKSFNRPEIKKVMEFVKQNKGAANKFIVVKWDRFARDTAGAYAQIAWFNKHGIEVNSLEQPIDFNNPEQTVMLAIYLSAPEAENLRRGMNVRGGIRKAKLNGNWTTTPPRGYDKVLDKYKKPYLVKNDLAPLVIKAFQLYGSGNYSQIETLKILRKKGFKLGKTQFSRMLRNVAYIGKITVNALEDEPFQIVDGIHEPLISEDLFNRVQLLLDGKKPVAAGKMRSKKDELPLRGFIVCKACGKKLTGSPSRGNGGVYYYYHCRHNCKTERYRAEGINKSFTDMLGTIQINPEVSELYYEVVRDVLKVQDAERGAENKKLDADIEKQKQRLENLHDAYVDGGMKQYDYEQTKTRYEKTYNTLIMQRTENGMVRTEYDNYLKWGFALMGNLTQYYEVADVTVKQQIVGSIFTDNFVIEQNKVRTNSMNELIALITKLDAGFSKKKSGKLNLKLNLSAQAERKGFEPSKHFHAYTLSRRAPSTTRTPL